MRRAAAGLALALCALAAGAAPAERAELERFVERRLAESSVPGVAVAVIRGHRLAWARGFGVANSLSREPVTADTVFAVASNGKPVTAWLAVQAASQRALALDWPAMRQATLTLPRSREHQAITPLHLLTHSSGLGNFLRDEERVLAFPPGSGFAYSGVGFMVLQQLLEARTGRTLDSLAQQLLFAPLAMRSTSFGALPPGAESVSDSHIALRDALAPFAIVALPAALLLLGGLALGLRIARRRALPRWALPGVLALVAAGSFAFLWSRSGSAVLTAWFALVPIGLLAMLAALVVMAGRVAEGMPARRPLQAAVALAFVAGIVRFAEAPVPVPHAERGPNAAASLRASAPDLARFLVELVRPTLGDVPATHSMGAVHRQVDETSGWGLGIGVERHAAGRDLWHWGANPGARSLMVMSPVSGDGVVVLTNAGSGSALVRAIAARAMGREGCWRTQC